MFPFRQGVIWLLLAMAAEIPPVVRLGNFSSVSCLLIPVSYPGIHSFGFEWYFFLSWLCKMPNMH